MDIDTIYFNGIDVDEGTPAVPAMSAEAFADQISQVAKLGHTKPANLSELKFRGSASRPRRQGGYRSQEARPGRLGRHLRQRRRPDRRAGP